MGLSAHKAYNFAWCCTSSKTLGENQDTSTKRINSWKIGYQNGQHDLIIMNFHKDFAGCFMY